MIPNQWYAVLSSHQLKKGKVVGARRFGKDLVFFRNQAGEAGCVTSLCAHRGASLAKGCISHEHIRCPFHGIEYDPTGKCVFVPSDGKASTADYARFHLESYHLKELGGIIFAWYGEGEPDKEPDCFDVLLDPSYTCDHMNDAWKVHYSRVIENQLDVSHLAFVHKTTIGRGNKTLANGPKIVWLDDNTLQTSANNEVDEGQIPKPAEECEIRNTNLTFKFPNMWLNHVTDKIMIFAFFIPVDEENSIIALRFYNKITGMKWVDKVIAWFGSIANRIIERQDKRIVETQLPKKSSLHMQENLVSADMPIIQYRSKREQLIRVASGSSKQENQK
ncbi:MAG: aromatic ring-hydroxylating dioxygenase subunit alpha [Lachnospiraceae bacterium]|nr:aromatic ring-hydroxylating dioxygenase subunit alpha [Lachnospiraceae bacterium]